MILEKLAFNLNPKALLSWPVFLVSLAWALFTNFLDSLNNPSGYYLERFTAVTTAHILMFLAIFALVRLMRNISDQVQALIMVPMVVAVAMLRGYLVWSIMSFFQLDPPELISYRVFGAVAIVGIPLILVAIAVQRYRSFTDSQQRLEQENERLLGLRTMQRGLLRQETEEKLAGIRSIVLGAIESEGLVSADAAGRVSHTLESVVRPISQTVDEEEIPSQEVEAKNLASKINWRLALTQSISARFLKPVAVALALTLTALLFLTSNFAPLQALALLAMMFVGTFSLVWLCKRAIGKFEISRTPPRWQVGLLMLLALLLIGFFLGTMLLLLAGGSLDASLVIYQPPFFITGIAFLFALEGSAQEQATAAIQQQRSIARQLAWEIARVSEERRQLNKSLANLLHGKLQSAFTYALLKLRIASEQGTADESEINRILSELRSTVLNLRLEDSSAIKDCRAVLDSLRKTWSDVATFSLELPEGLEEQLQSDPQIMQTLVDLVFELAFNAIKHGDATEIQFTIAQHSPRTIVLDCLDNGQKLEEGAAEGLGTKLFDECSLQWSRTKTDSGVSTQLVLPIQLP